MAFTAAAVPCYCEGGSAFTGWQLQSNIGPKPTASSVLLLSALQAKYSQAYWMFMLCIVSSQKTAKTDDPTYFSHSLWPAQK